VEVQSWVVRRQQAVTRLIHGMAVAIVMRHPTRAMPLEIQPAESVTNTHLIALGKVKVAIPDRR